MALAPRQVRPTLLREMNERAIFEYICTHGPTTRAELTRKLGMSAPAASRAVANLLKAGLMEAAGSRKSASAGRPGTSYALASGQSYVLGATIGLTRCTVVAAGLDGVYADNTVESFVTPNSYADLISAITMTARRVISARPGKPLGLGISVPGQIDRRNRTVMMSPNLHILDGQAVETDLKRLLKIRCSMFHETDCACMAELSFGAARGMDDFALVSLYEGFGVSAISSGNLLAGHQGLAGEIGHCTVDRPGKLCGCGNRGCLETVATDVALASAVSSRVGRRLDIDEVIRRSHEGKMDVRRELEQLLDFLAVGVGIVVNALNPQAVLLCGRLYDLDKDALNRLRNKTSRHALTPLLRDCQIIRAQGSTLKGAIACIIQSITDTLGPAMP